MLTAFLIITIFVLGFMAFHYWLGRGAIVSYVVAKGYPLPDDYEKWAEWYLKKSLGLTADLPDRL